MQLWYCSGHALLVFCGDRFLCRFPTVFDVLLFLHSALYSFLATFLWVSSRLGEGTMLESGVYMFKFFYKSSKPLRIFNRRCSTLSLAVLQVPDLVVLKGPDDTYWQKSLAADSGSRMSIWGSRWGGLVGVRGFGLKGFAMELDLLLFITNNKN